jgi:hypothetical protein
MRRLVTLLLAAFLLALPSAALAQSAGDEQYADPFDQPQQEPTGSQEEPAPAQEPAPAPAESSQTAAAPQAEVEATASQTLPATGLLVALLACAGGLLLCGGTMLRLRVS